MHNDHRAVLIAGYASGSETGPSLTSIVINGIEFTANMSVSLATAGSYADVPPMDICLVLREKIAAHAVGLSTLREFEADCISLPGEASLLLIQANPKKYPIATDEDEETEVWIKSKQRYLHMQPSTTDSTLTIAIVK